MLIRVVCPPSPPLPCLVKAVSPPPGQVWTSPLAVVAVVSFVMAFGIGMGPVPWLLPAELFAMDKCAKGSGIAAGANWLANFIVVQAFPALSNSS